MNDDRDRVFVEIHTGSKAWSLITSRSNANHFRDMWIDTNDIVVMTISGVSDDRDAHEVEFSIKKEEIEGIMIQEIKV